MDFTAARVNMVENQVRTNDVTDLPIQDAMRVVARERFCPPGKAYLAYAEAAVEYAPGLYLMEPRDVSKLLQAVYAEPGESALAIAAPYAAALLAEMGLKVTLRLPNAAAVQAVTRALDGAGVAVEAGDLAAVPGGGPYDVVVCEAAVPHPPQAWRDALGEGGRLGVVESAAARSARRASTCAATTACWRAARCSTPAPTCWRASRRSPASPSDRTGSSAGQRTGATKGSDAVNAVV